MNFFEQLLKLDIPGLIVQAKDEGYDVIFYSPQHDVDQTARTLVIRLSKTIDGKLYGHEELIDLEEFCRFNDFMQKRIFSRAFQLAKNELQRAGHAKG